MKHRTEWNLGLLYRNINDPQIEKDMRKAELAATRFEKKYKGTDFTRSAQTILAALKEYENLLIITTYKNLWYLHLYRDIENDNSELLSREALIDQRQRKVQNKILFFELAIAKIPAENQVALLADPKLQHYAYFLKKIFSNAKYRLSEKEEQLALLLAKPATSMWNEAHKKLLSTQQVLYKGKLISLSKATELYSDLPKKERTGLRKEINKIRKKTAFMAEAELNATYTAKKISDELRGYKQPYSETVLRYENEEKEVENLVKTITEWFSISHQYYKLHSKLTKNPKLLVSDIYAPIGKINRAFNFDDAVLIVKEAFSKFNPKYADLLGAYLKNGQIDVFPRKGKQSGAYSSGLSHFPVFVLMNYVENIKSVETLAHEMGHSIHTELSKHREPLYGEYTISVAEVASTFFEQFVSEYLYEILNDEEKLILLHQRIGRDMATIFRQIACFNCELEYHQTIRSKGKISKEEMAQIMQRHLKSYLGDAVSVDLDDGYSYVTWPHLRFSFYVYTYAYGAIISRALYERWKQDHSFKEKIEQFLSAGNSMSPKEIFSSIGITLNSSFFKSGLDSIAADIKKLERLAKKQKKI